MADFYNQQQQLFFDFIANYDVNALKAELNEVEQLHFDGLRNDLMNSSFIEKTRNPRFTENIIKHKFTRDERRDLRLTKRSALVKTTFLIAFTQRLLLVEELNYVEEEWRSKFFKEINPKFSKKAMVPPGHDSEINYLIHFYFIICQLKTILHAKQNKNLFIRIAGEFEGSATKYVTGGKNSPQTQRRIEIFEMVTGVPPRERNNANPKRPSKSKKNRQPQLTINRCGSVTSETTIDDSVIESEIDEFVAEIYREDSDSEIEQEENQQEQQCECDQEQLDELDLIDFDAIVSNLDNDYDNNYDTR